MWKASMSDSDASVTGLWRDSGSAHAHPARLSVEDSGAVTISRETDGGVLATCGFPALRISDRIGSIPRHLTLPDGGDFETEDNDGVDSLARRFLGKRGLIHGLEEYRPRLILFVAATIALAVLIYRYAVPVLVEVAIWATPPAVTELIDQGAMSSLDQIFLEESKLSEQRRKAISDGFSRLAALTPRGEAAKAAGEPLPYTLHFRRGGAIGPNAFALPSGTIVLTDELVELSKDDDDMILGVLAHEIGHVHHDHTLRQIYRVAGVTAMIMLIGGDIGAATEDVMTQGATLLALSYSRDAEEEADRYSVELMHKAGHDPAAIAKFFEILKEKFRLGKESDFMSSHPATQERIDATKKYAEELKGS
jgi:Zn-dependent protease with chaperone function